MKFVEFEFGMYYVPPSSKLVECVRLDFLMYGRKPCFLKHTSMVWHGFLQNEQILRPRPLAAYLLWDSHGLLLL